MSLEDLTCRDWIDVAHRVTGAILEAMDNTGKDHLQEPLMELMAMIFNGIIIKCMYIPNTIGLGG